MLVVVVLTEVEYCFIAELLAPASATTNAVTKGGGVVLQAEPQVKHSCWCCASVVFKYQKL
jgi:hypothetical protein